MKHLMIIYLLGMALFFYGRNYAASMGSRGISDWPARVSRIPLEAEKMTPDTDFFPPVLHDSGWEEPVPMPGPVNTAGAEDFPFITPDGNNFYFVFVPDLSVPPERQLLDSVWGYGGPAEAEETNYGYQLLLLKPAITHFS